MGQVIYVMQIIEDRTGTFEPGSRFPQADFLWALRNGDMPIGMKVSRRANPSEFTVIPSVLSDSYFLKSDNGVTYCISKNSHNSGGLQLRKYNYGKVNAS